MSNDIYDDPRFKIKQLSLFITIIFHLYDRFTCSKPTRYINIYFFCLYPINVKTAEPIGPNFFVGPRVTPGKVSGWLNFQKFASNKIWFESFENQRYFLENPWNTLLLFYNVYEENMITIGIDDGREAPYMPSLFIYFAGLSVWVSVFIQ